MQGPIQWMQKGNFTWCPHTFETPLGMFTYLKSVLKYYNFAIFQHIFCKTYNELLQNQAVNMDLKCILYIADSSYAVKTPKDKVTCDKYWNFEKKLKICRCFPQNGRFQDQTGGWETTSQNGRIGMYVMLASKREKKTLEVLKGIKTILSMLWETNLP